MASANPRPVPDLHIIPTIMIDVRFPMRAARALLVLASVSVLGACAGSTVGSGVGDRLLEEPPYYAGRLLQVDSQAIGVMPISYQRDAAEPAIFQLPLAGPLAALIDEMNAYLLDSLAIGAIIEDAASLAGRAPDVMFRCETDATNDCAFPEDSDPQMRLAVARPSGEWTTALDAALARSGESYALMITLEFSDYWTHQRNRRGSKEVRLGTDNFVDVPWLTSLETPVSVLQLTGAIIDRQGKAVRIGAEGLYARRTRFLLSALGAQEMIGQEDIQALRTRRREDLAGQPLAWKVALRNLVAGLTGRIEMAR